MPAELEPEGPDAEAPPPEGEPGAAEPTPPDAPPPSVDGDGGDSTRADGLPNNVVTIGSLEVDGVLLEKVECRVDGLGLLGALVVAQVFSARRGELSRCVSRRAPLAVRWSFEANRVTDASFESVGESEARCLQQALVGGPAPGRGRCTAEVTLP